MRIAITFFMGAHLLFAGGVLSGEAGSKQDTALIGMWLIVRADCCGEMIPLEAFEKGSKSRTWSFSERAFQMFVGGDKSAHEEGTVQAAFFQKLASLSTRSRV